MVSKQGNFWRTRTWCRQLLTHPALVVKSCGPLPSVFAAGLPQPVKLNPAPGGQRGPRHLQAKKAASVPIHKHSFVKHQIISWTASQGGQATHCCHCLPAGGAAGLAQSLPHPKPGCTQGTLAGTLTRVGGDKAVAAAVTGQAAQQMGGVRARRHGPRDHKCWQADCACNAWFTCPLVTLNHLHWPVCLGPSISFAPCGDDRVMHLSRVRLQARGRRCRPYK